MEIKYKMVGDQGLLVEFDQTISPQVSANIRGLINELEKENRMDMWGIKELIPTYCSLLILYHPLKTDPKNLQKNVMELIPLIKEEEKDKKRILIVPTLYGGEFGPDLDHVAKHAGLTAKEVVEIHSKPDYLVYMLGFTPGFTYLGGLDPRIATPRLENARINIPAGSVGIAENQTGIYPIDSPGGWQLIGKTPLELYRPKEDPPVLIGAGDYIRFQPIDKKIYHTIKKAVASQTYKVEIVEEMDQ